MLLPARCNHVLATLSCGLVSCLLAQTGEWGQPADGLRMSLAIPRNPDGSRGGDLQIALRNIGQRDVLVNLGKIIGARAYPDRILIVPVTLEGHRILRVIHVGGPGAIGGRLDPLVIPLLAGGMYTLRIPAKDYYLLDERESLETFLPRLSALSAEWEGVAAPNFSTSGAGSPMLPFWAGKLTSNTLLP